MMHVSVDILVAFSSTWRQCITEASVPDANLSLADENYQFLHPVNSGHGP